MLNWLGDCTFADLRLPLALTTVDLNSSRVVVLREGKVVDAVRATIALPGIFSPAERDEQLLVDGGLLDNLPADVVREGGADVVIAVDVATDFSSVFPSIQGLHSRRHVPERLMGTVEVLYRSLGVMMAEIHRRRLAEAHPEIVIQPPIPPGVTVLTGFRRAAEVISAGEEATISELPHIRELLATARP